jgi:hypothetical protein
MPGNTAAFIAGAYSRMTKAANPVMSTMKATGKADLGVMSSNLKGAYSNAMGVMGTGGFSNMTKAKLIGGDIRRRGMSMYNQFGAAKSAGYGAAAIGGGAAAADFMNPWGLGFGD